MGSYCTFGTQLVLPSQYIRNSTEISQENIICIYFHLDIVLCALVLNESVLIETIAGAWIVSYSQNQLQYKSPDICVAKRADTYIHFTWLQNPIIFTMVMWDMSCGHISIKCVFSACEISLMQYRYFDFVCIGYRTKLRPCAGSNTQFSTAEEVFLKQSNLSEMENSSLLVELEPTTSKLHTECSYICICICQMGYH